MYIHVYNYTCTHSYSIAPSQPTPVAPPTFPTGLTAVAPPMAPPTEFNTQPPFPNDPYPVPLPPEGYSQIQQEYQPPVPQGFMPPPQPQLQPLANQGPLYDTLSGTLGPPSQPGLPPPPPPPELPSGTCTLYTYMYCICTCTMYVLL